MLRGIGKPYVKSLDTRLDLPPDPPYGLNWGHKIANFANLISKLNFYKLIPYPMDNC